ncbi:hypothetical protein [Belnapia moabensis]|uniref:hypothetical protein n=1 Tax=Belnapia moabensis TaxID=365533 RepID=UPI00147001D4|nr:hypothetical protein [Belnapia moabensis]
MNSPPTPSWADGFASVPHQQRRCSARPTVTCWFRYPQPQPGRRSLELFDNALAPLLAVQQASRLSWRHSKGGANLGGLGDAPLIQLAADRHLQPDHDQPISISPPALLGRDLRFRRQYLGVWWQDHIADVGRRSSRRYLPLTQTLLFFETCLDCIRVVRAEEG